ncbi:MAG: hypothetical protein Q7T71_10050 [Herbiconiux sp.]|nr:hypothetical protein [Herbiconiux sp.]
MTRPKSRTVVRMLVGLVLVAGIAILGSIAIRQLAAPKPHDLYWPVSMAPSCAVSDDGEVVLLVMTLEPKPWTGDPSRWHVRAEPIDSSNVTVLGTDIWDAGVGFGPHDSGPTGAMVGLLRGREGYDPTTTQFRGTTPRNVAVALALDDAGAPATLGPLRIVTVTGEPEYWQSIPIQLSAHRGECLVGPIDG